MGKINWRALVEWSHEIFHKRGIIPAKLPQHDLLFVLSEIGEVVAEMGGGPFAELIMAMGDAADALVDMSGEWRRTNPWRHAAAEERLANALAEIRAIADRCLDQLNSGGSRLLTSKDRGEINEHALAKEVGQASLMMIRLMNHYGGNPIIEVERWANRIDTKGE